MNPLLFYLSTLLTAATAFTSTPSVHSNGFQYGIQMDAGSSGTRLYVYKWNARIFKELPPSLTQVMTEESWSKKQNPGISTFGTNPTGAGASIQPLLDFAIDVVLKSEGVTDVSTVPVFLGATAGLRMLAPSTVTAILTSVQSTVKNAGFMYKKEWIRVLSGEEEGAFGWVAANSLLGTLTSNDTSTTVGALDLGGASTQSTFHPSESILAGLFPLSIANVSHSLYTHSYLYYGADQARYSMYLDLIQAASKTPGTDTGKIVINPCFPTGYESTSDVNNPTIVFKGSSDWNACLAAATKLITDYQPLTPSSSKSVECLHSDHERCTCRFLICSSAFYYKKEVFNCCNVLTFFLYFFFHLFQKPLVSIRKVNGVYQPAIPSKMKLLAMASFYYNWGFFKLTTGMKEPSSDLNALVAAAESFCNLDAIGQAAYNNSLPHPQHAPFVYDYCFGAAYSHALLHTGYGLPLKDTPLQVVKTINGNDVGWAYGAMLWEINRLGWSYDGNDTCSDFSVPFYVAIGGICLLGCVIMGLLAMIVRMKRRGENDLNGGLNYLDLNGGDPL